MKHFAADTFWTTPVQLSMWDVAFGYFPDRYHLSRTEHVLFPDVADALEFYNEKCDDPAISYRSIDRVGGRAL